MSPDLKRPGKYDGLTPSFSPPNTLGREMEVVDADSEKEDVDTDSSATEENQSKAKENDNNRERMPEVEKEIVSPVPLESTKMGTWTDPRTELMWLAPPPVQEMAWEEANTYCSSIATGGHSDWRQASIKELLTLSRGCDECRDKREGSCMGCDHLEGPTGGCYWPNRMKESCGRFWSSTTSMNYTYFKMYVDFRNGGVGSENKRSSYGILCLRGSGR